MTNILEINNLTVKYGKNIAIEDISFQVDSGDYLGIVGPNGSGKTTLINSILGLINQFSGDINLKEGSLGYLPQKSFRSQGSFPAKVSEIIATGLLGNKKGFRFYNKKDYLKVDAVLDNLNITHLKNLKIGELSGGQQQRVFLARAMVSNPSILILDEPTNYLDSNAKDDLYLLLNKLNTEQNVTMIVISHDLASIGKYINKVLYLENKLKFFGSYHDFLNSLHKQGCSKEGCKDE